MKSLDLRFLFCACIGALTLILSCQPKESITDNDSIIRVRIPTEPDRLNPILARSSYAVDIQHYVFFPLAEFDPVTLELAPLLIENIPEPTKVESGPFKGDHKFQMKIRDEAVWHDGKPITGLDYQFTVNAVFNPNVEAAAWRSFLVQIKDIEVDPINPKNFSVIVEDEYMLSKEIMVNFNILPKHVYDSSSIMDSYTLQDLKKNEFNDEADAALLKFADNFSDVVFSRDIIVGSGPYKFDDWVTNQWIRLTRVEDWWGEKFKNESVCFENNPKTIEFVVITDESTSLVALKSGEIDVMARIGPEAFLGLKEDITYQDKLAFLTPEIMQYYYIALNNLDPILEDKNVRKALVSTLDYEQLIRDLMKGLAKPTIGPFHPSKLYYAKDLELIDQDLDYAARLLEEAGWEDTNDNGTIDKRIEGKQRELKLKILVSKNLGEKIALLLQKSAGKIGIEIEIDKKPMNLIRSELRNRDYQMAALATRLSPSPDDPYQSWHTDNISGSGTNRIGFGNEESDRLIEKIRSTQSSEERYAHYQDLQKIIYDEQPMIFLFSPLERIAHNKSLDLKSSVRRPGYFLNAVKKAS